VSRVVALMASAAISIRTTQIVGSFMILNGAIIICPQGCGEPGGLGAIKGRRLQGATSQLVA
jgi:hypothetical protein